MVNKELNAFLAAACICAAVVFYIYGEGRVRFYSVIFLATALYFLFQMLLKDKPESAKIISGKAHTQADLGQNGEFTKEDVRTRAISAVCVAAKRNNNVSFMLSYRFKLRMEHGINVPPIFGLNGHKFTRVLVLNKPGACRDHYELYMEGSGTSGGAVRRFKVLAVVIECDGKLYLDNIIPKIPGDRMQEIKDAVRQRHN